MAKKPRPTPNTMYQVQDGDTLDSIEIAAYGQIVGILEQTTGVLNERTKRDASGRPEIYARFDIIAIPSSPILDTASKSIEAINKLQPEEDELTVIIEGTNIPVLSANVLLSLDKVVNECAFRFHWSPGEDKNIDKICVPLKFNRAQVFIGRKLILNGWTQTRRPAGTVGGVTMDMTINSPASDIVDSTMLPPYTASNVTLSARANHVLRPFGILPRFAPGIEDPPFDKVTGDVADKVFKHLDSLASQRRLLMSSDATGNILFRRANVDTRIGLVNETYAGSLTEGHLLTKGFQGTFSNRGLFSQITALGGSPGSPASSATVMDPNIPKSKAMVFKANETNVGGLLQAAKWRLSKQYADTIKLEVTVSGWYNPNSVLWDVNTVVDVTSPTLSIPNGHTFLIRSVRYGYEVGGRTTKLSLVLPESFSGDPVRLPRDWI